MFGASIIDIKKAKRICAPANKFNEDPTAPFHPEHLTSYTIKQTSPRFQRLTGQIVENQFGTIVMDVVKPDRLLVPTAKSLDAVPPLPAFNLDHFKCYRIRLTKQRISGIPIEDQFGAITVDIKKPLHLCVAADKNGEGINHPGDVLMCYMVRQTAGTSPGQRPEIIFATNQFGPDSYGLLGPRELCVPSLLNPVP